MSLDAKGLPERFFSLFPRHKQWEIAECLYPDEDGRKKQPQISRWSKGLDPIPMDALDRVVDLGLANWDWLLTGKGAPPPSLSVNESPPPAVASGEEKEPIDRVIEAVFLVQEALARFGKALAMRKSAKASDFPELPTTLKTLQRLQGHLRVFRQTPESHDRSA